MTDSTPPSTLIRPNSQSSGAFGCARGGMRTANSNRCTRSTVAVEFTDKCAPLKGKTRSMSSQGGGILPSRWRRGALVTGIDLSESRLPSPNCTASSPALPSITVSVSAEDTAAQERGQFDAVTQRECRTRSPDPVSTASSVRRMQAKPGGDVFFPMINRNPKSFAFAIVGAEYVLNMLPRVSHEYALHYSRIAAW